MTSKDGRLPRRILGGAWGPQHEQIVAGIFQSLFVAAFAASGQLLSIDFIPAHILQATPEVFEPRAKLSINAKRAGWQGFYYDLSKVPAVGIVRVHPPTYDSR